VSKIEGKPSPKNKWLWLLVIVAILVSVLLIVKLNGQLCQTDSKKAAVSPAKQNELCGYFDIENPAPAARKFSCMTSFGKNFNSKSGILSKVGSVPPKAGSRALQVANTMKSLSVSGRGNQSLLLPGSVSAHKSGKWISARIPISGSRLSAGGSVSGSISASGPLAIRNAALAQAMQRKNAQMAHMKVAQQRGQSVARNALTLSHSNLMGGQVSGNAISANSFTRAPNACIQKYTV